MEDKVGYGFRPTDDELVGFFLRNKIEGNTSLVEGSIREVNICSFDPWNLRFESRIKSRDPMWYFFSRRENKYANGDRQSRRTSSGFWKITGDPVEVKDQWGIWSGFPGKIGLKRVLVFLTGKSSKGIKSDWVMHEFHCTLFPEHQRTYVICRLEYKGDDRSILFVNPTYPTPTFVPNATNSAGSVVNQSRQGQSGFSEYDSANQAHQFNGNFNTQQPAQGNPGSFNHFSLYDSANQGQQNFNTQQPVEGFSESFNPFSEYASADQGQWISDYFNLQQEVPYTAPFEDVSEIIRNFVNEEVRGSMVDERTSMQEHCSDYQPKKPVTGVFDDDSGDSDTDSMTCGDTSSSTDSVGSSSEPNHTPIHDTPSVNTIEPLHNYKTQEQPKQLKLQLQSKEKVIDTQKSKSEWKMAEDSIKQTPATNTLKQSWIVLEKIQRNEQWNYLKNMIIGFLLLCISIIGWIILVG